MNGTQCSLVVSCLLLIWTSWPVSASVTGIAIKQSVSPMSQQGCDLAPMSRPEELNAETQLSLGQAQKLSQKEKAELGFRLLHAGPELSATSASFIDYFIAQMYANAPELAEYRILLLKSALQKRGLSGAELQDAVTTLGQLYLAEGQEANYRHVQISWSRSHCDPTFFEALPEKRPEGPRIDSTVAGNAQLQMASRKGDAPKSEPRAPNSSPKLIQYLEPKYPPAAYEQEISGFVSLSFTITKDGNVAEVTVIDAEPAGVFEQAAMDAVRHWVFQPMLKDGQAVAKPKHRIRLLFDITVAN